MRSSIIRDSRDGTEASVRPVRGRGKNGRLSGNGEIYAEGDIEQMEEEIQRNTGEDQEDPGQEVILL